MTENENTHLDMCAAFHLLWATVFRVCVRGVREQGQESSNTTEASCAAPPEHLCFSLRLPITPQSPAVTRTDVKTMPGLCPIPPESRDDP